jgi:hypothetical protein
LDKRGRGPTADARPESKIDAQRVVDVCHCFAPFTRKTEGEGVDIETRREYPGDTEGVVRPCGAGRGGGWRDGSEEGP